MSVGLLVGAWPGMAAESAKEPRFERIVLIGASVSAGFCTDEFLGGRKTPEFRFANYLEAALTGHHEPVTSQASKMLFLDPLGSIGKQVAAAIEAKPTLVLALDAMFWCCYGGNQTPEQRLERFEAGLKLLEKIEAPLVLGDLPDASRAVGGILSKDDIPPPEILQRCNARLKEWAGGRRGVSLFPLAAMMKSAGAGEEFVLAGRTWPEGRSDELLQRDHLHPSPIGLAALAVASLDQAAPGAVVRRDLEAIRDEAMTAGAKQSVEEAEQIQKLIEEHRQPAPQE